MNYIIIKPGIKEKFDRFVRQERILFFSAACGFGKTAIAKYRMNDSSWRADMENAVNISAEYGFICPISGYGISVLPILEECVPAKHKKIYRKAYKVNKGASGVSSEFSAPRFLSVCGTSERCGNAGAKTSMCQQKQCRNLRYTEYTACNG